MLTLNIRVYKISKKFLLAALSLEDLGSCTLLK